MISDMIRRPFTLVDDLNPQLGGTLDTNGNPILITDDGNVPRGSLIGTNGTLLPVGAALSVVIDPVDFDTNDGIFLARQGAIDLYGQSATIHGLNSGQTENRQVYCTPQGVLYTVVPPAPGWQVSDTDNGNYPLPTLALWVNVTGLIVIVPQNVANGDRIDFAASIHFVNSATGNNRSGSVDIGYGVNGAQPLSGANVRIEEGFDSVIPVSFVNTAIVLTASDTISIWVRRSSQDHAQFSPAADARVGAIHQFTVSKP